MNDYFPICHVFSSPSLSYKPIFWNGFNKDLSKFLLLKKSPCWKVFFSKSVSMHVFDNCRLKGQAWPWKGDNSLEGAKGGFMLTCISEQRLFREVQPAAAATRTKKKKKKKAKEKKKGASKDGARSFFLPELRWMTVITETVCWPFPLCPPTDDAVMFCTKLPSPLTEEPPFWHCSE